MASSGCLGAFLIVVLYYQCRIDGKLKIGANAEGATDGRIAGLDAFGTIADLDNVASRNVRDNGNGMGTTQLPGMHHAA